MRIIDLVIAQMPNRSYKVIIWGQHDDHIMDWNGCNYRYIVAQGQPRKGFNSPDEALAWWESLTGEQQKADELYCLAKNAIAKARGQNV